MSYLWIKGLHIGAVLLFMGGLMLLAVVTSRWSMPGGSTVLLPHEKRIGHAVLDWDRRVTLPAMATVWALGMGLSLWGGWTGQGWLWGKIACVVALCALHGFLSGALRRRMRSEDVSTPPWLRYCPGAIAVVSVAIAVLVTVKP